MTLDKAKPGQKCRILALPGRGIRAQTIRFGISEGQVITCANVIPGGPVIVTKKRQEIAIGRGLAKKIKIEPVPAIEHCKSFSRGQVYGLSR
ncbi:MAG: ferrous iron transport protein A [Clostridia bacterium]|nr:ferrous iron transport protein A [Clostridia bacterium]